MHGGKYSFCLLVIVYFIFVLLSKRKFALVFTLGRKEVLLFIIIIFRLEESVSQEEVVAMAYVMWVLVTILLG